LTFPVINLSQWRLSSNTPDKRFCLISGRFLRPLAVNCPLWRPLTFFDVPVAAWRATLDDHHGHAAAVGWL
jgi:hypothetical protein